MISSSLPRPICRGLGAALFGLAAMAGSTGAAQADKGWRPCATEGQLCELRGEALVRFGTEGRYVFRVARGGLPCEIDSFGSDPVPGRVKRCEVAVDWQSDQRYRYLRQQAGEIAGGWRFCAYEGNVCQLPAPALVRYGAEGRYAERQADRAIACNNHQFGDPFPDMPKRCEYSVGAASAQPSGTGLPWVRCASERGYCSFRGPAMLRYGAPGGYIYREVFDGQACNNDALGGDPAPDRVKQCELLRLGR